MMMRVFFLLILLWNIDEINSAIPSKDAEDDVNGLSSDKDDCSSGTYIFYSFADVSNSVSCNIIIDISTDIVLSSNVLFNSVNNITIIGQGNPTVNCNNIGSMKFVSCNNVTIEGVNWERCGSVNNPGMELYNTSNIAIQNCSFHHSAVKLLHCQKFQEMCPLTIVSLHTTNTTQAMEQLFTMYLAMNKMLSW